MKARDVCGPFLQGGAAVDQVDGDPVGRQDQRGVEAGRSGADDHEAGLSTSGLPVGHLKAAGPRRLDHLPRAHGGIEQGPVVGRVDHEVGVHDETQTTCLPVTARIDRTARDADTPEPFRIDTGRRRGPVAQCALGLVQTHLEVEHAPRASRFNHATPPTAGSMWRCVPGRR